MRELEYTLKLSASKLTYSGFFFNYFSFYPLLLCSLFLLVSFLGFPPKLRQSLVASLWRPYRHYPFINGLLSFANSFPPHPLFSLFLLSASLSFIESPLNVCKLRTLINTRILSITGILTVTLPVFQSTLLNSFAPSRPLFPVRFSHTSPPLSSIL